MTTIPRNIPSSIPTTIPGERVTALNNLPINNSGRYVLYWMDASLRQRHNSALEYAIALANEHRKGVVVLYCLSIDGRINSYRRAKFVLEALRDLKNALNNRGIQLAALVGSAQKNVPDMARRAIAVVTDKGYLRQNVQTRYFVAQRIECPLIEIEDNSIVPVETASQRQEYSARTFRPKVNGLLDRFLKLPNRERAQVSSLNIDIVKLDLDCPDSILRQMNFPHCVAEAANFPGGELAAQGQWRRFLRYNLARYDMRQNPEAHATSMLSPYLSFGCISPVEIILDLRRYLQQPDCDDQEDKVNDASLAANAKIFQEELVVRRELAINYVWYNPLYDCFDGLPAWAQRSLETHAIDDRTDLYSKTALEKGKTIDIYWNKMQNELVREGWLMPHARMYWGKRPLLWTRDPAEAFETILAFNDKYELDGMSPGGFAGVGWCYGLHDLPFHDRPVWGYIRPMTPSGIIKKMKIGRKTVTSNQIEVSSEQ